MKYTKLLLCLLLCLCLLAGCVAEPVPTDPAPTDPKPTDPTEPAAAEDGVLKILAIGGSFSIDAMEYLYQIARDGGVEKIVLGNLYSGGASIGRHLNYATTDHPGYSYYKNTAGTWEVTEEYRVSQALEDENWDVITNQQSSGASGMDYTYEETLTKMVDYVRGKNSTAKLLWHITWAYQGDYKEGSFTQYDYDQQKMYGMIIDCVQRFVLTEPRIDGVIPAGTAIQNARTSFLGDTLTRDGFHLDYHIGRYIAGLTWYAAITGRPVDEITYNPSPEHISEDMLAAAREAVQNAILAPYAVTPSARIEGTRP